MSQLRAVEIVGEFVAESGDADQRRASSSEILRRVFLDISPADLTADETAALVAALAPAFGRVTGISVNRGAPTVPRARQMGHILSRVTPADLTSTEVLLVLTILVPAHSRVLARSAVEAGQPVQRLLLAPVE